MGPKGSGGVKKGVFGGVPKRPQKGLKKAQLLVYVMGT
jgi:hypothetical protein